MAPHRYDVSLMVVTNCESSAGTMLRRAWGRMMYRYICGAENPWERAASYWPAGTLAKPPRTISATERRGEQREGEHRRGQGRQLGHEEREHDPQKQRGVLEQLHVGDGEAAQQRGKRIRA